MPYWWCTFTNLTKGFNMSKKTKLVVIREYFGVAPSNSLKEFSAELKALSAEEKLELARGAATNLGLTQEDVDFDLA